MIKELDPIVGNWYRHRDKGQMFTVVDVDPEHGLVEIQHYDGDVEEIETRDWADMDLELAAPPEDVTGPLDEVEPDDLDYSETDMAPRDWRKPLEEIPQDEEPSPEGEEEQDEWGEGESTEDLYGSDPDRE
jgi:hypothetical protein